MKEIIKISNASVIFNNQTVNQVVALDDFSLEIKEKDVFIINGYNGSGKSTLLNLINGNIKVSKGKIQYSSSVFKHKNKLKLITTIYQNPIKGLCIGLTVYENLLFSYLKNKFIKLRFIYTNSLRRKIIQILSDLKLEVLVEKIDEKIENLSGGQQQLVSMAKIAIEQPKLLLLDEPTSALDKNNSQIVDTFIVDYINKTKTTTLWVTHKEIPSVNNNFKNIFLEQGKIK